MTIREILNNKPFIAWVTALGWRNLNRLNKTTLGALYSQFMASKSSEKSW